MTVFASRFRQLLADAERGPRRLGSSAAARKRGMVVVFRCLGFDCCDLQVTATRDRRDARRRQQRRMGRGAVQGQLDFKLSGVARQ